MASRVALSLGSWLAVRLCFQSWLRTVLWGVGAATFDALMFFTGFVAPADFTGKGSDIAAAGGTGTSVSGGSLGCFRPFNSFETLIADASLLKSLVMMGRALLMQKARL